MYSCKSSFIIHIYFCPWWKLYWSHHCIEWYNSKSLPPTSAYEDAHNPTIWWDNQLQNVSCLTERLIEHRPYKLLPKERSIMQRGQQQKNLSRNGGKVKRPATTSTGGTELKAHIPKKAEHNLQNPVCLRASVVGWGLKVWLLLMERSQNRLGSA